MEEKLANQESNHNEGEEITNAGGHGWQKVTYAKKNRKAPAKPSDSGRANGSAAAAAGDRVFGSLERQSEERRRRIEAQKAAIAAESEAPIRSRARSDDDDEYDDDSDAEGAVKKGAVEEKKPKQKKPKKPKVTIAEAAAKIEPDDLAAFLVDVSASYESQQDIQLMRFADYFGRAFSGVSASQFPWTKMFRESPIAKIADVPVSHIPEAVYKTSVDWINQRSYEALGSFVLWSLDSILATLASQSAGVKGSKKGTQQTSSKSQVAIFSVLAMVLRRKPDVLVNILPTLKENPKYQGQDKLTVIVWMITQACQGDLAIGLYLWAHFLLPILGGKSGSNPQTRDLVLQLGERILSAPKARTILANGAVRKGERLIPPFALDILLRVTFPASSARVKATERFEAIHTTLVDVALAGSPGSKAMKQVAQQIWTYALKAAGEGVPELANQAIPICIWCLAQNPDCYKQWDKVYLENLEASVSILRKLCEQWKTLSLGRSPSVHIMEETFKSFRQKNEKALAGGDDATHQALFKAADKYCKTLLGRLSRGHGCLKGMAFAIVLLAAGAAAVMYPEIESFDWNKLSVLFTAQQFS